MVALPSLFISHGAPDLPLRTGAAVDFLRSLPQLIPTPQAILVISAHWLTATPLVSAASQPQTMRDFSGFPAALYRLVYPAPGAPAIATRVVELLTQAGLAAAVHPSRGLDHGAWTPLYLAYPAATIPVTQLSLQYRGDPEYHWRLGQALAPLRQEGVLIIGSGSATHNLSALAAQPDSPPLSWVEQFEDWLTSTIQQGDWPALRHYRQRAPYAPENHPTEEHLLPLFVALGAAGEQAHGRLLHHSISYGALSMAAYAFQSAPFPLAH